MGYHAEAWGNFFLAQAGAAAALTGLLFVAVSMNIREIMRWPHLPGRAGQALVTLVQLLIVAAIVLIPGQGRSALGAELVLVGAVAWLLLSLIAARSIRALKAAGTELGTPSARIQPMVSAQVVAVPIVLAGATLLAHGGGGLYWLAAGTGLALVAGVSDAWVLLIEILR